MNSKQIQEQLVEWGQEQNFSAPYGVLTGEHQSKSGAKYKSVTFGYARTLDATVDIYNRNFMIYKSSAKEQEVFKTSEGLMKFLNERFGVE